MDGNIAAWAALFAALGLGLFYFGMKNGKTHVRFGFATRADNPIIFWFFQALHLTVGCLCLFAVIRYLVHLF